MKCPTCKAQLADDAAVCPSCDTVVDPSLLEATPPRRSTPPPSRRAPVRKAPAPRPVERRAPSGMPVAPAPRVAAVRRDWRQEVSQEDWDQMPQGPPREHFVPDKALDPDDVLLGAREFLLGLNAPDKLTFFGTSTMFLACFFPWKETVREGEVLGLMSLGLVVFLLSLAALALLVLRSRRTDRRRSPFGLWALQLAAIVAALLVCVVYAVASLDTTSVPAPIGTGEMWVSKPSFGVIMAFLAGLLSAAGTLLGLREGG
jgi:hypothetical protein